MQFTKIQTKAVSAGDAKKERANKADNVKPPFR